MWLYQELKFVAQLLPYTNLLPPGAVIKDEDWSPGAQGKEDDLEGLSTKASIIGMEEGSAKQEAKDNVGSLESEHWEG